MLASNQKILPEKTLIIFVKIYLVDVGLEKCQISDLKQRDYSFVEKIDWNRVYSPIDIRRKESLGYLKCIVEQDSVNSK